MKIVQFIRNRMRMRYNNRAVADEQDLALYRQLRKSENKLHDARALLGRMLESQGTAMAESARIKQAGDDPDQQDNAPQLEELQQEISCVQRDVSRLELEYQHAQMNVRTYFYLETSLGSRPEGTVVAAHSVQ